jgi:sorbitol-specific phosphotransferase system component IIBC
MTRLHLRYFLTSLLVCAATALGFQSFVGTILVPEKQAGLVGAAFIAGWWGNLIAVFIVALMAARKAAQPFIDPRLGRVAGSWMGVWVGLGAAAGNVAAAAALSASQQVELRLGLVVVFSLISLIAAVVTSGIAGRETAHPPESEEEAV